MIVVDRRSQIIDGKGKTESSFPSLPGMTGAVTVFFFLFLCMLLFTSFSPCLAKADLDDNLKGVPPSAVSEWNYYGFSAEDSGKWIEEGIIFAGWAAQWRDEGFSAESAGKWRKVANVYTAGDFLRNGFAPAEAQKWIANGIRSGLRAREYLFAGLTAEEAASYWTNGIYPDEIKEWRDAGFTAEAMLQWRYGPKESTFFFTKDSPYGRTLYKLETAIQWRNAGFTAQEMQASGPYRFDLADAIKWKDAGFKFEEAVQWRDLNFSLHEALIYKDSGLNYVDAERQRYDASGDQSDEITSLDTDITLNRDGSMDVVEMTTIIDRPGGIYEKGYYKDLPKQARLQSLRSHGYATKDYSGTTFNIKSVEIDGKPGDYYIADNVLHFGSTHRPLPEGTHLIKIIYSTDGRVLYEPHHDELCFGIIDENPPGRYIRHASAIIRLPRGAHVIFVDGNAGLEGRKNYTARVDETDGGDVVRFSLTSPLKTNMHFTTNVGFIKGYVAESTTHKFVRLNRETGRLLTSLAFFATVFAILFLYYFIVWVKVGRDPESTNLATTDFSPPEKMDPAMLRFIHTKGKVDHLSVSAELLYLAEHELITISGSSEAFKIKQMSVESVTLPPVAKQFYTNLWAGIQTELSLLRGRKCEMLSVAAQSMKTLLKKEKNRNFVSNSRYLWPGIILAVLSIAFSLGIIDYQEYGIGKAKTFISIYTGFMILVFAVLIFIFMRLLRSTTPDYAKRSGRAKHYVDYVTLSYADLSTSGFVPSFLREHLPYAVAAGLDVDNATIHKGDVKWYHGPAEGFRCGDFNKTVKKSI